MRSFAVILLLLLSVFAVEAQDAKKIKALFKQAEEAMLWGDYPLALSKYLELEQEGLKNSNIYHAIGICYLNIPGEEKSAIVYLEKGVENITTSYKEGNPKEEAAPEEAWFYLAKAYRYAEQFQKSIDAYKKYKTFVEASDIWFNEFIDLQIQSCENAIQMMGNPISFKEVYAEFNRDGETINPVISGDGKSLFFTAFQETVDQITGAVEELAVIYYSMFNGQDWSEPVDITSQLVSDGYLVTCHVSFNGDYLLLYRNDYGDGNIYYSDLVDGEWTAATKMKKNISSALNESFASISPNGEELFFSRETEFGAKDIFVSQKDKKGRWGLPVSLGDVINTPYEEDGPVIANDGKTLYFASEAHNSMGGYDVFKSVRDEVTGIWSEPQNLGYPLNTSKDDVFYMPIGDQTEAYMARYSGGQNIKKIFRLEFSSRERKVTVSQEPLVQEISSGTLVDSNLVDNNTLIEPVAVQTIILPSEYELKGTINLENGESLNSGFYVHVVKESDGSVVAAISPDISTGSFRSMLKPGSYKVRVFGDGYETAEQPLYISDLREEAEILSFVQMKKVLIVNDPVANTVDDQISKNNSTAKINTNKSEQKAIDAFSYELKGKLRLGDNRNPDANFKITITEQATGVLASEVIPDQKTGNFVAKLKDGSYQVKATGNGYEPAEKTITITPGQSNSQVFTFLEMRPLGVSTGEYIAIKSILFDFNSTDLDKNSLVEIEKLARLMEVNPTLYVEVQGNTDDKGTDEYNFRLSVERSQKVIDYLQDKGISTHRFVAKGYGKQNAIAINNNADGSDNPEGRALNRRVDIKVFPTTSEQVKTENIYVPDELLYRRLLTYTVLLAETDQPLDANMFQTLTNVWINRVGNGYMYSVGKFSKKADALNMMQAVVDGGFPDARIVSSLEYAQLQSDKEEIYKAKLNENDKRIYTIQLAAVKKPLTITKVGSMKVNKTEGTDGYLRYSVGEYVGKVSARQALVDVINKGYHDAFIVEKSKLIAR